MSDSKFHLNGFDRFKSFLRIFNLLPRIFRENTDSSKKKKKEAYSFLSVILTYYQAQLTDIVVHTILIRNFEPKKKCIVKGTE